MKLRKIDPRRYVDDETGTYFDFLSDTTAEEALEQVLTSQRIFLEKYPSEEWFGTMRTLPRVGKPRVPPRGIGGKHPDAE